jgi:hypothetical protein
MPGEPEPPAAAAPPATSLATSAVDLRDLVMALAPLRIGDGQGDEWRLDCPRHQSRSGRSLRVDGARRAWWCHGCRTGATGDAAAFTLARWLLPKGTPDREIFDALRRVGARDGR